MFNSKKKLSKKVVSYPLYTEQVAEMIKQNILSGKLKAGERINEVELSEAMDISRSPVREAIQRLSNGGLIELIPRKGAFVSSPNGKEIKELLEVREPLEVTAVALAVERASESQLKGLSEFLDRTRSALERDRYKGELLNLDFHRQIAECAHNKFLEGKVNEINMRLLLVRHRSGSEIGRAWEALIEHDEVVKDIKRGNLKAARKAMRYHLSNSKRNIFKLLAERASDIRKKSV